MNRKSSEFSTANFISLLCAIALAVAFLLMPWISVLGLNFSGIRALSEVQSIQGQLPGITIYGILLIPFAAGIGGGAAIWGLLKPTTRWSRLISFFAGFAGILYFVIFLIQNSQSAVDVTGFVGTGFWVALFASIGLVVQVVVPHPTESKRQAPADAIRSDTIMKRVFLTPTVVILLGLSIFPLLWSLGISFTDMQRGGSTTARTAEVAEGESVGFLGLGFEITGRNYERLLTDNRLHTIALNTLFYVFAGVAIQYVFGFFLALLLNQEFLGRNIIRIIFLMPMMMTPVAAAYAGRMMFDSNASRSPLAHFLREASTTLGFDPLSIPWLTDTAWAPLTVVLIDSWQWIPFMTLILLAGMQAIPDDIYEAARVDGATTWQIIRKITFPILLPISLTVILIRGLEIFKIIDVIVVTTGGGPGSATESLTMYIFKTALTFGNFGYAAAISFVLLVLVIIFASLFLFVGRRLIKPMQ